jgi:hypothetical protein
LIDLAECLLFLIDLAYYVIIIEQIGMEAQMHIGMLVGVFMIVLMIVPALCCRVSQDKCNRIIKRYEQVKNQNNIQKQGQGKKEI